MLKQPQFDTKSNLCQNMYMPAMKIMNIKRIKKEVFSYKEALKYGLTRQQLRTLLETQQIERIERGVYQLLHAENTIIERFKVALTKVEKPSAICLLSALEYYHLTDTIPHQTWVMVPVTKRISSEEIREVRVRNPKWKLGIKKEEGILITSIERTIIDSLVYAHIIGANVGIAALKIALKDGKVKLKDIIDLAIKMKVYDKIQKTVQVFV